SNPKADAAPAEAAMRKKQSSTRRMAGSDEDDLEATAAGEPPSPPPNGNGGADAGAEDSQAKAAEGGEEAVREAEEAGAKEESAATPVSTRTRGSSGGGGGTHTSPVSAPGIYDTVKCTACGKRVNPYNGTMQLHPMLSVLVCQRCYKFYRTGQFDIDHDGKENQCRWCGEGGSLICCDRCQHSFCKSCIRRNLGRSALQSVEELPDDAVWSCYMCDSAPLLELQTEARVVMQAVRDKYSTEAARSRKQQQHQQLKLQQQKQQQQQRLQQRQGAASAVPAGGFMGLKLDMSSVPRLPGTTAAMATTAGVISGGLSKQQQQQRQRQQLLMQQQQRFAQSVPRLPAAAGSSQLALQRQQQQQLQQLQKLQQQQQQQLQQRQRAMAAAGSSAVMTEQWYKKNVRIESILADIESVNTYNIGPALNATVTLLQGMMRQYSRLLQDLAAVRTNQDRAQVVSRFKSAYRMHLFLRLGKLRSLIAEQDRHSVRKAAPAGAAAATPKPAGLSLASVLPQSSASTMAAAAALQLPGTASKTVMDAQNQAIPIAELLPELNRNIREMIERQNQARRDSEAAAAAAASGVAIVSGGESVEAGGEGDIVVLSDKEASCSAGADGIAELLTKRRQREAEASAGAASVATSKSRKKSQPRKITLPATNRRIALGDGDDEAETGSNSNGIGEDADVDYGNGADDSAMPQAAAMNENGDDGAGEAAYGMEADAAPDDAPGDAGDAPNDVCDALEDVGEAPEDVGEARADVGEAPGDANNGTEAPPAIVAPTSRSTAPTLPPRMSPPRLPL
ncbi:hypothetical protein BOX15_Mlig031735g2, partial [Macrostomum lignano]